MKKILPTVARRSAQYVRETHNLQDEKPGKLVVLYNTLEQQVRSARSTAGTKYVDVTQSATQRYYPATAEGSNKSVGF